MNIMELKDRLESRKSEGVFRYEGLEFSYDDYTVTESSGLVIVTFLIEEREASKLTIFN